MTTVIGDIEDLLEYNPETGEMFWKVKRNNRVKAGDKVSSAVNNCGYINVCVNRKHYLYHRLAFYLMEGYWPTTVDHLNRDKSDNRWCNLRAATYSENNTNRGKFTHNRIGRSGVKGVTITKEGKYLVRGRYHKYLGTYDSLKEAEQISNEAWREYEEQKSDP